MPRTKNVKTAARKPSVKSSSAQLKKAAPAVRRAGVTTKQAAKGFSSAAKVLAKKPVAARKRSNWERPTVAQLKKLTDERDRARSAERAAQDRAAYHLDKAIALRRTFQGTPVYRSSHRVHNNVVKAMVLAIVVLLFIAVVK